MVLFRHRRKRSPDNVALHASICLRVCGSSGHEAQPGSLRSPVGRPEASRVQPRRFGYAANPTALSGHGPNTSDGNDQLFQLPRIKRHDLTPILGHQYRVRMPETPEPRYVKPRLDAEHHACLQLGVVAQVQERAFVNALTEAVTNVVTPVRPQVVLVDGLPHSHT